LEQFSIERDSFAPIVYKILTFSLVENYSNPPLREFILANFSILLKHNSNIPIGILLDPLLKQMQVSDLEEINIVDFDFCLTIAKHPKLNVKNAIQGLDLLGKLYLSSAGFGRAAGIPFVIICTRFVDTAPLQEYLYRFCKYALKLVVDFEKQRKAQAQKKVPKYLSNAMMIAGLNEELPEEAISGQRRIMTYDLVSRVIGMKNMNLNIRLKELLVEYNFSVKKDTGKYSKGMTLVLGLLGNAEEILAKAEDEEQKLTIANSSDMSEPMSPSGKPRVSLLRSYIGLVHAKPAKASSRMPKRRVLKAIEKAKKRRADREASQALLADQQKRQEENQKRFLRKQLNQMKIASTDSSDQALILPESTQALPQTDQIYTDISLEAPEDQEGVNFILRKYTRVLKLLYDRYASSGYRKGNHPHELIGEHQKMISEAEMYRLVKEQGAAVAKDAHSSIFKTYCLKTKRADKVDYEGYLGLVIQEAIYIFSKPPKDLAIYPVYVAVSALFDLFRATSLALSTDPDKSDLVIPLKYYDEPDPGAGDREIVKKLNTLLSKDPTAQLPEGYRKATDKELEVHWELPASVNIPQSARVALCVLDEIVLSVCERHILEPLYSFRPVVRARGVLAVPALLQSQSSKALSPFPVKSAVLTSNPELKYQATVLSTQFSKEIVAECAKLVDDLVYSVQMKSSVMLSRDKKNAAELTNKVKLQRDLREKEMELEREKAEQRRKLRQQVVKEKLKNQIDSKQSVSKAEQEQRKLAQQEKLAQLQKRSEDRQQKRQEQGKLLEDWRKMHSAQLDPESEAQNKAAAEAKRKQQEEFLARERKRIKDLLHAKEQQRVELLQHSEEEEKRKLEMRKNSRQRLVQKLETELKRHEEAKAKRDQINRLAAEPEFSSVLREYERSIEVLFRHYSGQTTKPGQNPVLALTALQYVGFNKFVTQMEVCPNLVTADYCLQVFRQLTKDKMSPEMPVIALNLEDFKTALIRLAVGGKATLHQMTGKPLNASYENSLEIEDFKDFLAYLMLTSDHKKTAKTLQGLATLISKKRNEGSTRPHSKTVSERASVHKSKSTSRLPAAEI